MSETGFDAFYLALMLILPISALAARRLPTGRTLKMALAWIAIFGMLFVLISLWQGAVGSGVGAGGSTL